MSNKLVKKKTPEKENSLKAGYGRILLCCGIGFLLMMIIMWQFPTNLDGNPLKLIFTAGFVGLGILLCTIGICWMVKKPKVKLGKFMARILAKKWQKEVFEEIAKELPEELAEELKVDEDEMVETMKDFEF